MRILGIERDSTACNYYRVFQPLQMLQAYEMADVCLIKEGPELGMDSTIEKVLASDIIVFQRPSTESWYKFIKTCRKYGKIIVSDYDDDPFNTSPWNPYYRHVGIEEVRFRWPDGKVDPIWTEDMKSATGETDWFNIERNIHHREMFTISFKKSDMVTTTTPILQETLSKINKNTVVLPNLINPDSYVTPEMVKKEVRIGWQGGVSHYEDLYMVRDAIKEVLHKHDNVKFVYFGDPRFLGLFSTCDQNKIEFVPWCAQNAYNFKLALLNLDIGLAPVVDNMFNRNKSAIKWMEYSMVGAATVASNIPPYSPLITNGKDGILVEGTTTSWVDGIEQLLDVDKRRKMADNARENVIENHNAHTKAHLWHDAYQSILKGEGILA